MFDGSGRIGGGDGWMTNSTVAIQQTQNGTVGANTGAAAAEEFKVQDASSLDKLHAGDTVTYSATETGGAKTITKLQKQ